MTRIVSPDPIVAALDPLFNGETVLAAVSGGPDSMALFNALCMQANRQGRVRVVAAHFDHGLRPDCHRDLEAVQQLAARYGVCVIAERGDVNAHARASKLSIEAAARELRYAFLDRAAEMAGADVIATAHTRDDQHETVVMRMLRGAGDRGLRGIHPQRGTIVRPLLAVTHEDTLHHCRRYGVPYVLDPSNEDSRFFRNRVRKHVMPALRGMYGDLDVILDEISKTARERFEKAQNDTDAAITRLRREGPLWCLPLSAFNGLNRTACVHLLMRVFRLVGTDDNVTEVHYSEMLKLVSGPTGRSVDLPEIRVRRDHDALVFMPRTLQKRAAVETTLPVPGVVRFKHCGLSASHMNGEEAMQELSARVASRGKSGHVAFLATAGPLTIRFPRPGDIIRPFGMTGHKKLSDLFIDCKIPHRFRASIPVVECEGEILWVLGVATSESARCRQDSPSVVRIRAWWEAPV